MFRLPLACPRDHSPLRNDSEGSLLCGLGHRYPVIDGIPVLLLDDVQQTMPLVSASIRRARGEAEAIDPRAPNLFLESLGISEAEKDLAAELARRGETTIDPVVSVIIAATSGYTYKHLIGKLKTYPIPDLRLPPAHDKTSLLDIGCNWGRWSIAAARKGYRVVGIDPSLGAIMAARGVARQLGLEIDYLVGDARYLPFPDGTFDTAFSYSVIQHFSKPDAVRAISDAGRVLKPSGKCLIQMAHAIGVRSLYHQCRRRFREASRFEVRYWTIPEMRKVFEEHVGPATVSTHCYFGLALEPSNLDLMPRYVAWIIAASEGLRALSTRLPLLTRVADSIYVSAVKGAAAPSRGS